MENTRSFHRALARLHGAAPEELAIAAGNPGQQERTECRIGRCSGSIAM